MSRVCFLIAGVQKCGTTALDGYLRAHPELEMATPKETHYFDREDGVDWRRPDAAVLHRHYGDPARLWGEATPVTLYWLPAHYRVLRYNPAMRFVLLFRDPAARAWSHWAMNHGRGIEPLSFSDAIRDGRRRVLERGDHVGLSRHFSYVERGFYARQLKSLMQLFPREQMLTLTQTMLSQQPDACLRQVTEFLGVAPLPPVAPQRLNVSRDDGGAMTAQDAALLRDLYAEDQAEFTAMTGLTL